MSPRAERVSRIVAAIEILLVVVPLGALLCLLPAAISTNVDAALEQLGNQSGMLLLGSFGVLFVFSAVALYVAFRMLAAYAMRGASALAGLPSYMVWVVRAALVVVVTSVVALLALPLWSAVAGEALWFELHLRLLSAGLPLLLPWAHLRMVAGLSSRP